MASIESIQHSSLAGRLVVGPIRGIWTFSKRYPLGTAGGIVILAMLLAAICAPLITSYDPEKNDYASTLMSPGWEHLLGTDQFGRDLWARVVYGARTALLVGLVATFAGATIGMLIGVTSAYIGGVFDHIVQRAMDVIMSFPLIIMALVMVSVFGSGTQNVILAITIPFIPKSARVIRSSALSIREQPYIDAARVNGFSLSRIILRHIVPNVMAPYLILVTSFIGQAILLEASLSYLGLGVQEPTPAWGLMLQGGAEEFAYSAPWIAIWPGLAISLAVLGFNLLGDAVRDALDPKLRH